LIAACLSCASTIAATVSALDMLQVWKSDGANERIVQSSISAAMEISIPLQIEGAINRPAEVIDRPTDQPNTATLNTETLNAATPAPLPVSWKIQSGEKISDAFLRWSKMTNKWKLVWEASELIAQLDLELKGTFEEAVRTVIVALNRSDAGLEAKFYVDEPNQILRIMEKR
jgi:hypothetical protein